nr:hypothetical protein Iba_chr03cCG0990 [Ipomoea batatas]
MKSSSSSPPPPSSLSVSVSVEPSSDPNDVLNPSDDDISDIPNIESTPQTRRRRGESSFACNSGEAIIRVYNRSLEPTQLDGLTVFCIEGECAINNVKEEEAFVYKYNK